MSDRLLYQSEAEQLVLERGFVVAEPEVPFFWGPLKSGIKCLEPLQSQFRESFYKNS